MFAILVFGNVKQFWCEGNGAVHSIGKHINQITVNWTFKFVIYFINFSVHFFLFSRKIGKYLIPSKGKWERVPTTYLGTLIIKAVHSKGPLLTCKSVCHLTQIILLVKQFSMKLTTEIWATQNLSSCATRSWWQINVQKYFPVSAVVLYIPFTFYPHAYNTFLNLLGVLLLLLSNLFLGKPIISSIWNSVLQSDANQFFASFQLG